VLPHLGWAIKNEKAVTAFAATKIILSSMHVMVLIATNQCRQYSDTPEPLGLA
jgi:hypothetical protein